MAELITICWRDIPSQIIARAGRRSVKRLLAPRFQEAIDRAAMRAGKGASDAYMEDWQRLRSPCGSDLEAAADAAADALEDRFDAAALDALAKARGQRERLPGELVNALFPEAHGRSDDAEADHPPGNP